MSEVPAYFLSQYGEVKGREVYAAAMALRGSSGASVPVESAPAVVIPVEEAAPVAVSNTQDGEHMKLYDQEWQAVTEWALSLPPSDRPHDVWRVLLVMLGHIRWKDRAIDLGREGIAAKARISPNRVSRALGVLAKAGIISRERVPITGVRGQGAAIYRLSARVGGKGDLSKARREEPVPLLFAELGTRQHHKARDLAPNL